VGIVLNSGAILKAHTVLIDISQVTGRFQTARRGVLKIRAWRKGNSGQRIDSRHRVKRYPPPQDVPRFLGNWTDVSSAARISIDAGYTATAEKQS